VHFCFHFLSTCMATNENAESAVRRQITTHLRHRMTVPQHPHTHTKPPQDIHHRYEIYNRYDNRLKIKMTMLSTDTKDLLIGFPQQHLTSKVLSLPSCLTWSCCHDVSPRRNSGGTPKPDRSPGCPHPLPLPAACPSPSEPTAVETEPATYWLPWLPSSHYAATAGHTGRHPQPLPKMTTKTTGFSFPASSPFLSSLISFCLQTTIRVLPRSSFSSVAVSVCLHSSSVGNDSSHSIRDWLQKPIACKQHILSLSLSLSQHPCPTPLCFLVQNHVPVSTQRRKGCCPTVKPACSFHIPPVHLILIFIYYNIYIYIYIYIYIHTLCVLFCLN